MIRGLVAGVALAATVWAGDRLERVESAEPPTELLYLPSGRMLRAASLGHPTLVADAVYLWAIQYYSNYEREDRFRYVRHVFENVITELDPNYVDAYWLGALILVLEARDLDAGLALLDKGAAANPDEWILPYLAGWECYHAGRKDRAQEYFRQAMARDGAPAVLPRLIAGIEARKGNVREAMRLWETVLHDPGSDANARAIAERRLRDLQVEADRALLARAIQAFRDDNGTWPRNLDRLVAGGYVSSVPVDPSGEPYAYDPATGAVGSSAGRLLGAGS